MIRRVRWRALLAVPLLLAGCEAARIAAPAGEAVLPPAVPQLSMTGGLQCTETTITTFTSKVVCTLDEGSDVFVTPENLRVSQPVLFELAGGSGGLAGPGGVVKASITATLGGLLPLTLRVGGEGGPAGTGPAFGQGGANGGGPGGRNPVTDFRGPGGGGKTEVLQGPTVLMIAGGGGGAGGHAGPSGADGFEDGAGKGGNVNFPGAGGTWGAAAACSFDNGAPGGLGTGGAGGTTSFNESLFPCYPGGGGGAGRWGGGGGAYNAGGGGGSNYIQSAQTLTNSYGNSGNGWIRITYFVAANPPRVTVTVVDAVDAFTQWYNASSSGTDGVEVSVAVHADADFQRLQCYEGVLGNVLNVTTNTGSFTLPDGTHSISCVAYNGLEGAGPGSTAMPLTINVDQTGPSLAPSISPSPIVAGGTYTASANATDATSGVAKATCGPVVNNPVGAYQLTCDAWDRAGNNSRGFLKYKVVFNFAGFFEPVNNGDLNVVPAGRAVPVKFSLGGDQGLDIMWPGYPLSQVVDCNAGAPTDEIEQTVTAGSSSLAYDAATGTYTYVWKSDKTWAGSCRQLIVRLIDGTEHTATFKFIK